MALTSKQILAESQGSKSDAILAEMGLTKGGNTGGSPSSTNDPSKSQQILAEMGLSKGGTTIEAEAQRQAEAAQRQAQRMATTNAILGKDDQLSQFVYGRAYDQLNNVEKENLKYMSRSVQASQGNMSALPGVNEYLAELQKAQTGQTSSMGAGPKTNGKQMSQPTFTYDPYKPDTSKEQAEFNTLSRQIAEIEKRMETEDEQAYAVDYDLLKQLQPRYDELSKVVGVTSKNNNETAAEARNVYDLVMAEDYKALAPIIYGKQYSELADMEKEDLVQYVTAQTTKFANQPLPVNVMTHKEILQEMGQLEMKMESGDYDPDNPEADKAETASRYKALAEQNIALGGGTVVRTALDATLSYEADLMNNAGTVIRWFSGDSFNQGVGRYGGSTTIEVDGKKYEYTGNIDLYSRPQYVNPDGSISTVDSISVSFAEGGPEYLIPTIVYDENGKPKRLNRQEAEAHFLETGEYLGVFNTPEEATAYAEQLHKQQEAYYSKNVGSRLQRASDTLSDMSQKDILAMKDEYGNVGDAALDIGVNLIQMGYDAGIGATLKGTKLLGSVAKVKGAAGKIATFTAEHAGLIPMFFRSSGGGMREARYAGASDLQQFLYGTAAGVVETVTELIGDGVAGIYGAAFNKSFEETIEMFVSKTAQTSFGRMLLRGIKGAIDEGLEEVVSDFVNPFISLIYDKAALDNFKDPEFWSEMLYDFFIGAAVSGVTSTTSTTASVAGRMLSTDDVGNIKANMNLQESMALTDAMQHVSSLTYFDKYDDTIEDKNGDTEKTRQLNKAGVSIWMLEGLGIDLNQATEKYLEGQKISEGKDEETAKAEAAAEANPEAPAEAEPEAVTLESLEDTEAGAETETPAEAPKATQPSDVHDDGQELTPYEQAINNAVAGIHETESTEAEAEPEASKATQPSDAHDNGEKLNQFDKPEGEQPNTEAQIRQYIEENSTEAVGQIGNLSYETTPGVDGDTVTVVDEMTGKTIFSDKITESRSRADILTDAFIGNTKGAINGQNSNISDGRQGRKSLQRTSGQDNGVQTVSESAEVGETQQSKADRRRNAAKSGAYEKVRCDNLMENGSEDEVMIVPESDYDDEIKTAVQQCETNTGIKPTVVIGTIKDVIPETGEVISAAGYYGTDANGNKTIIVRADHKKFTVEQLTKHESFHAIKEENPGLLNDCVETLISEVDENTLRKNIKFYAAKMGFAENSDLAWEEMIADIYGDMNRYVVSASNEGLNSLIAPIVDGRLGKNSQSQGTQETNGPNNVENNDKVTEEVSNNVETNDNAQEEQPAQLPTLEETQPEPETVAEPEVQPMSLETLEETSDVENNDNTETPAEETVENNNKEISKADDNVETNDNTSAETKSSSNVNNKVAKIVDKIVSSNLVRNNPDVDYRLKALDELWDVYEKATDQEKPTVLNGISKIFDIDAVAPYKSKAIEIAQGNKKSSKQSQYTGERAKATKLTPAMKAALKANPNGASKGRVVVLGEITDTDSYYVLNGFTAYRVNKEVADEVQKTFNAEMNLYTPTEGLSRSVEELFASVEKGTLAKAAPITFVNPYVAKGKGNIVLFAYEGKNGATEYATFNDKIVKGLDGNQLYIGKLQNGVATLLGINKNGEVIGAALPIRITDGAAKLYENFSKYQEELKKNGLEPAKFSTDDYELSENDESPEEGIIELQVNDQGESIATYDENSESVAARYSHDTWEESDYVTARDAAAKEIADRLEISVEKAKAYIDDINTISAMIAEDLNRLDYKSSPGRSSFVSNVEYGGSFDFSTLCKKRRLITGTLSAIQKALPNTVLTAQEILDIRNMMKDAGLEVNCGLCYVEGSRANMGVFTNEFLKLYKKYNPGAYVPNMAEMNTPDGIEQVRIQHPEVYEQYEKFWNNHGRLTSEDPSLFASQQKPKLYQLRTEYKGEILTNFRDSKGNVDTAKINEKNKNGGIRCQSFSDFEIVHLIDMMQIVMDMSRVGLAGQAYTKVPEFAWALGDTGMKINLSLIAKDVDADGNLVFDDVEGMPYETAMEIRDEYPENVGTIIVVFTDAQLKAAMADDTIDYIIPFHRSQWKKSQYADMGLPTNTKDFTYIQNEKWMHPNQHTHEYQGRMVKDKATNFMPNEYWDYGKSGKENAENYLRMCFEADKRPKFYKLLDKNNDGSYSLKADGSTDGYWKLLIDFKMYDNDGVGSPQLPVKPEFNMEKAQEMLNNYQGGHEQFPIANDIVKKFVKQKKAEEKPIKLGKDGFPYAYEQYVPKNGSQVVGNIKYYFTNGSTRSSLNNFRYSTDSYEEDTVYVSPKNITPYNDVNDRDKLQYISNEFSETGWKGRPIVAIDNGNGEYSALTGSHRIWAAMDNLDEIPVVPIEANESTMKLLTSQEENDEFDDEDRAELAKQLYEDGQISKAAYELLERETELNNEYNLPYNKRSRYSTDQFEDSGNREEYIAAMRKQASERLRQEYLDSLAKTQGPPPAPYDSTEGLKLGGMSVNEYMKAAQAKAELARRARTETILREDFKGSPALEKLGIKVSGSVGLYEGLQNIIKADKQAKALRKQISKAEDRLNVTPAERQTAELIASKVYTEDDIPKNCSEETVRQLADLYSQRRESENDILSRQKRAISSALQEKMTDLFAKTETKKTPQIFKMHLNTPERNMRTIFGNEAGKKIYDAIFAPVYENSAEAIRFTNAQFDAVRKIEGKDGKKKKLTKKESELTMKVIEGRAAAEMVAGNEMRAAIESAVQNARNGGDLAEEMKAFNLGDAERQLAKDYQTWLETVDALDDPRVDKVRVQNAADLYTAKFNDFYDAINEFLVAHGYETIGFIKGYAPHKQVKGDKNLVQDFFSKFGIGEDINNLPTEIAGLTASYKPNKRWNPYFLERTGNEAEYDIVDAYESYIRYLSDIFYHTDDVMRIREMSKWFRTAFSRGSISDEIKQGMRFQNAPVGEKRKFLETNNLTGRDTPLTDEEVDARLDQYVQDSFKKLDDTTTHGAMVVWLDNYANLLAGKQSVSDRSAEQTIGRKGVTLGNKLSRAFAMSQVGAKISSVLNQTAQLPIIYAELGPVYTAWAIKDIVAGRITKASWLQESDFLTGKDGIDFIQSDFSTSALRAMFYGAEFVDKNISAIAVRGAYLKAINKGMNHKEAMRHADNYAAGVMGNRLKGTKPTLFDSKNIVWKMVTMFQLEALNTWEHTAKDLPYAIQQTEKEKGKAAAAFQLAATIVQALLASFVMNRIDDELYGGTPAPYDILGLTANFMATGEGLTTNDYLKQLVDNVTERILDERIFDTEESPKLSDGKFDYGKATKETIGNISNDLPIIRNLTTILGMGDDTLPLAGLNSLKDVKEATDNYLDGKGKPEKIYEALGKFLLEFAPGGSQIRRTGEGIKTYLQGGRYNSSGNLQYAVDQDPLTLARLALFGQYSTPEAQEYFASGYSALSDTQMRSYNLITNNSEFSNTEVVEMIRQVNEIKAAYKEEKIASGGADSITMEDAKKILQEIEGSNYLKAVLWQCMNASWKGDKNPFNTTVGKQIYNAMHDKDGKTIEDPDFSGLSLPNLG